MSGSSCCLVVGDVHGHLQLALGVAARWQRETGRCLEAVLLCGDVGTFVADDQLDNATRRHGRANPAELEFLRQWTVRPVLPWLEAIFQPLDDGGLGLDAPVIMVHGNHEGFASLESAAARPLPADPVSPVELATVDAGGWIRYLPSGWRCRLASGLVIGGVGGIESGQRKAGYHDLAYIREESVAALAAAGSVDVLITHQGPALVQGDHGTRLLDPLADLGVARVWCHGHSTPVKEVSAVGPGARTRVVPLGDVAFMAGQGSRPGTEGWCWLDVSEAGIAIDREAPAWLSDYRRSQWFAIPDGPLARQLVLPELSSLGWRYLRQGR